MAVPAIGSWYTDKYHWLHRKPVEVKKFPKDGKVIVDYVRNDGTHGSCSLSSFFKAVPNRNFNFLEIENNEKESTITADSFTARAYVQDPSTVSKRKEWIKHIEDGTAAKKIPSVFKAVSFALKHEIVSPLDLCKAVRKGTARENVKTVSCMSMWLNGTNQDMGNNPSVLDICFIHLGQGAYMLRHEFVVALQSLQRK